MPALNLIRKKAFDEGQIRYHSDTPCRNGHVGERYSRNSKCVQCAYLESKESRRVNRKVPKNLAAVKAGPDFVSLQNARDWGLGQYYNGIPCKNGHITFRRTNKAQCLGCEKESHRLSRTINADKLRTEKREWKRNAKLDSDYMEKLRAQNKERYYRYIDSSRRKNSARSKRVRQATPTWLTQAQRNEILSVYEERDKVTNETGVKHHVDHEVPLKGRDVCGLHVPWNLRVLESMENFTKNNRMPD